MNTPVTNEKRIIIEIRVTRNKLLAMLTALFVMWFPRILGSETLQLTTYYPAPYGGYARLLTTDLTALATNPTGNVGIGTTNPQGKLHVAGTGNVLFNTSGNIGINTTNPSEKLVVASGNVGVPSGNITIGNPTVTGSGNGWLRAEGLDGMCKEVGWTAKTGGWVSTTNNSCDTGYIPVDFWADEPISFPTILYAQDAGGTYRPFPVFSHQSGKILCCKIKKN